MAVSVKVSVTGHGPAIRKFRDDAGRFASPMRPLLDGLGSLSEMMRSNIRDERITLPALHPQTLAIREYYGHAGKPKLIRGGDLVNSIRPLSQGADFVEIGTDHVFASGLSAADLERGGVLTDNRGRKRYVQPFPFLPFTEEMGLEVERQVADYYMPLGDWR